MPDSAGGRQIRAVVLDKAGMPTEGHAGHRGAPITSFQMHTARPG